MRTVKALVSCSLGDGLFSGNHSVDTIDHILNKVFLRSSESSSVGDIVGTVIGLRVLSVDTSDLHLVFVSNFVESFLVLLELWERDMDGSSHGGTKVGWA